MRKIPFELTANCLFEGQLDENNPGVVSVKIEGKLVTFDLIKLVSDSSTIKYFNIINVIEICKICNIKSVIYPNGRISFSKLDSSEDELKTCYVSQINNQYLVVVALDEVQPMIYRAQLLTVFHVNQFNIST